MAAPTWAPTPAQVGALLPARFGPAGPSTTSTPSLAQIQSTIEMLTPGLLEDVGTVAAEQYELAHMTLMLGTAAYIENALYPEQNDGVDTGNAEFFRRRYQEHVALLRRAIRTAARFRLVDPLAPSTVPGYYGYGSLDGPYFYGPDVLPGEGWTP